MCGAHTSRVPKLFAFCPLSSNSSLPDPAVGTLDLDTPKTKIATGPTKGVGPSTQ